MADTGEARTHNKGVQTRWCKKAVDHPDRKQSKDPETFKVFQTQIVAMVVGGFEPIIPPQTGLDSRGDHQPHQCGRTTGMKLGPSVADTETKSSVCRAPQIAINFVGSQLQLTWAASRT
jgi:hypothetical protein